MKTLRIVLLIVVTALLVVACLGMVAAEVGLV